jgi:hypothetical protein
MRKLTLDIANLSVDSFDTGDQAGRAGTVRGKDTIITEWCTGYPDCISRKGAECQTPYDTCYGSCGCTNTCPQWSEPPACEIG